MTNTIYIVWGPTAEWGDGSGPLFCTDSYKDAARYVRGERKQTIDYAVDAYDARGFADVPDGYGRAAYDVAAQIAGWPYNAVGYWITCEDRATLLHDTGYDGDGSIDDDVFAYLNDGG